MNVGKALSYKYGKDGFKCDTRDGVITRWEHPDGIPKPDNAQIIADVAEYESNQVTEKNERKNRKKVLLTKLGLNKQELKTLLDLIQDGNDD